MCTANLLKELIIQKYGEEKFKTGCQLLSQWLSVTAGIHYTPDDIIKKASQKKTPQFPGPVKEAIHQLFGTHYDP